MAKSKSYGGLIVALIVIGGGAYGIWYYVQNRGDKQPEFQTTKVARGDITQSVTATGDLAPVTSVDIGAQVSGQIKEVLVDYNSKVKAGDVLAKIDPAPAEQKLKQAQADLESAKANNLLLKVSVERTRDLFQKKLVSQSELDTAEAQFSQSNATLVTRTAAVDNAKLDLDHCVITAPIDGMVLDRKTDVGRTVNASMNAPLLFTLVNDLAKMQINAAIAEADIGTIAEGQTVKFTVDAYPNRTFNGTVRMVRNNGTTSQSVVSYVTIIDVNNEDLKLKPGMTANVSVIVQQRPNVLRVANGALRVRIPQELLPAKPAATPGKGGDEKGGAVAMTDDERMRNTMEVIRATGWERGSPPSPDQVEKAKVLAKEKGLDPDMVAARMTAGGRKREGGGGGDKGRGGGGGGFGGGGGNVDRGFNNTIVTRTLYKLLDNGPKDKKVEPVSVKLGISDGFSTEVLDGLKEGDTIITNVTMPGAAPILAGQQGMNNPFQSGGRSFGGPGGMRGGR